MSVAATESAAKCTSMLAKGPLGVQSADRMTIATLDLSEINIL